MIFFILWCCIFKIVQIKTKHVNYQAILSVSLELQFFASSALDF